MNSHRPSPHLTWRELACKDGTPYPINDGTIIKLTNMFESIRSLYNKPIKVVSAYRTVSHNKKISGARNSQHLLGKALDLKPPNGITVDIFYNDIKSNAKLFGIGGIGKYKTFIHVDIRKSSKLVVWFGSGVKDS